MTFASARYDRKWLVRAINKRQITRKIWHLHVNLLANLWAESKFANVYHVTSIYLQICITWRRFACESVPRDGDLLADLTAEMNRYPMIVYPSIFMYSEHLPIYTIHVLSMVFLMFTKIYIQSIVSKSHISKHIQREYFCGYFIYNIGIH